MGNWLKKHIRYVASRHIQNQEVRSFIFNRDDKKCVSCGNTENLQVDHIISAYRFWKEGIDTSTLNSNDNLQTLCRSCNASKSPDK